MSPVKVRLSRTAIWGLQPCEQPASRPSLPPPPPPVRERDLYRGEMKLGGLQRVPWLFTAESLPGKTRVFLLPAGLWHHHQLSSVQSLSHVRLFATPWTAARQASLSITNFRSLLKLMSIESVIPSNHLILCLPPSIFPNIRVFSNESVLCIRWPKYCSFSISISPSNEHLGLISFRMDWLCLLAVQGTLKSLLQHHSSKASIL